MSPSAFALFRFFVGLVFSRVASLLSRTRWATWNACSALSVSRSDLRSLNAANLRRRADNARIFLPGDGGTAGVVPDGPAFSGEAGAVSPTASSVATLDGSSTTSRFTGAFLRMPSLSLRPIPEPAHRATLSAYRRAACKARVRRREGCGTAHMCRILCQGNMRGVRGTQRASRAHHQRAGSPLFWGVGMCVKILR